MGVGVCLKRNLTAGNFSVLSANGIFPAEPLVLASPGLLGLLKAAAVPVVSVESKSYDEIGNWQISNPLWSE